MLVQIVLFDGFDLLDALAPYEVLVAGGALAGGALTVELAAADGPRDVPSGLGGPRIAATALDPGTWQVRVQAKDNESGSSEWTLAPEGNVRPDAG